MAKTKPARKPLNEKTKAISDAFEQTGNVLGYTAGAYHLGRGVYRAYKARGLKGAAKELADKAKQAKGDLKNIKGDYKWNNTLKDIRVHNFILNDNLHLIDTINKKDGNEFAKSDKEQLEKVRLYLLKLRNIDY